MTSGKHTGQFSATPVSGAAASGGHTGASLAAVVAARWPFASSVAGEGRKADEFASSGPRLAEGAEC